MRVGLRAPAPPAIRPTAGRPFGVPRNAPPLARTELPQGSTTAYFRATFDVDGAQEARELFFQPVVEDGAVIYLNGVEILRHNLPTGILDAETPALNAQGVPFAAPPIRLPVDLLRQGTNLLSAEVHVVSEGPGDLTFAGWVFAQPTPPASLPQMRLMLSELPGVKETSLWTELFRAETPFWIELFNAGNTTIPLDGLMLRRGASPDTSYTITAPELPPGGYLVLNDANLSRPGSAGVFGVPGVALGIIAAFGGFRGPPLRGGVSHEAEGRAPGARSGGAAAIVEEAGRHPGRLTGGAPRGAPAADGDAVAVEDERARGVAACPPSREGLGNGV